MEATRREVAWPFGRRSRFVVMRPQDHLVLTVTGRELTAATADGGVPYLEAVAGAKRPRLVVELPPAHVAEQVFQELQGEEAADAWQPEVPALPVGARFASPSRLAYVVAAGDRITLTVAGILEAMGRLQLDVVPLAVPRQVWYLFDGRVSRLPRDATLALATARPAGALDRVRATRVLAASGLGGNVLALHPVVRAALLDITPSGRAEAIAVTLSSAVLNAILAAALLHDATPRPPEPDETAIEVPSRLQLSPSTQGGWAHRVGPPAAGVVELWHTRLGVRTVDDDGIVTVDEADPLQRIVRAVWTRDLRTWGNTPPSPDVPFRQSTSPKDRRDIVALSTGADRPGPASLKQEPVDVEKLYLSSLGAFMDVRGAWTPYGNYTLQEWQHRVTLGRDQYVKVVRAGYLFPFGHRASLVTETRRKVEPELPGSADTAILWQRQFIIVREPTRDYNALDMPFTSVTIAPRTSPDIYDPGPELPFFWPAVAADPFPFTISAVDQDGERHGFSTPLLFVARHDDADPRMQQLWASSVLAAYGLGKDAAGFKHLAPDDARVEIDLDGRRIALAPKGPSGEATFETRALRFAADPEPETSQPQLLFGDLVIPAVAAATGSKKPQRLRFAAPYLAAGFDPATNSGEVVLSVARDATAAALSFAGATDRSGGFLNPAQHIEGISRRLGPIADIAKTAAGAPVSPASLFAGLGKLFGLFELSDVLGELGLGDVPAYAARTLDLAGALDDGLGRALDVLPDAPPPVKQAKDALAAALDAYSALMEQTTPLPDAAAFTTLIDDHLRPAVAQAAQDAVLGALPRAESAIASRVIGTLDTILNPPVPLPIAPAELLARIAAGEPVAAILNHVALQWSPPLQAWPAGGPLFLPERNGQKGGLLLAVDVRGGDLAGPPSAEVLAQLSNFTLKLVPGAPLLDISFERLLFRSTTGAKTEVDVVMDDLAWQGILGFVDRLKALIPLDGFSDPPSVEVDATGIAAGFSVGLPNLAIGVFSLSNISLAADLKLPFIGDAPTVGFAFCSRERPFALAVMFLGGGGFFGLRLNPKGVVLLEAALEFGATLALDFGVASGSVSVMAGVYLRLEADDGSLTGYLRIRGEVDVLGLISASIEMYMSLTYEFGSGKVIGRATITVEVEVLLFSASVSVSCERRFAGSNEDPTFAEALGPYSDDGPWVAYCQAFAEA